MSNEEMLYDDVAMENAHNLLVAANSKLILARDTYNSGKLSGAELVKEIEGFMDEATAALDRYNHAADEIYTGNVMNINFFDDAKEIEENGTYSNENGEIFSDSNETIKENEQEIQGYLSFFEERISCIDEKITIFESVISRNQTNVAEIIIAMDILKKYLYSMIPEELDLNNGYVNIDELIEFLEKQKNVNINKAKDIEITIQMLRSCKNNLELNDGSIEVDELIAYFENKRDDRLGNIDMFQSDIEELDEVLEKLVKVRDDFLELSESDPESWRLCDYVCDFFCDLTEENLRYLMEYGGFSNVTKKMQNEISSQWGIDANLIANGFRTAILGEEIDCYNADKKTFDSNLIGMIFAAEMNGSIKYTIDGIPYDITLIELEDEINNSSDWRAMDLLTIHLARNLLYEYWEGHDWKIQEDIDSALSSVIFITKQKAHDEFNMVNVTGWTYKGNDVKIYMITDVGSYVNVLPTLIHEVGHRLGGVGTEYNLKGLEEGINDWITVNIVRV